MSALDINHEIIVRNRNHVSNHIVCKLQSYTKGLTCFVEQDVLH